MSDICRLGPIAEAKSFPPAANRMGFPAGARMVFLSSGRGRDPSTVKSATVAGGTGDKVISQCAAAFSEFVFLSFASGGGARHAPDHSAEALAISSCTVGCG